MKYKYFFITMFLFTIVFLPSKIFAASVNISSGDKVGAGDTSVIDIYLNTEGQNINSIDGSIILSDDHDGNFEVKDLSLSNSAFTMWPRKPSLENGHKIYFVGGVPGGINSEHVLLFKVVVKINETGDFKITPNQLVAYLNDGLGTSIKIPDNSSIISIGKANDESKDKWKEIISNDNIAPEPFEVILSKDPNLFDGKKFIFFDTTDAQSGIAYYEVREDGFPPVRATTNYVLINQDKDVDIIVTAYDKAGNFQVATLKMKGSINWIGIVLALFIIIIFYQILKRVVKKRKKHAKNNS